MLMFMVYCNSVNADIRSMIFKVDRIGLKNMDDCIFCKVCTSSILKLITPIEKEEMRLRSFDK